jgi:hypothetical protein
MPAWSRPPELFESVWAYDLANGTIAVGWGELGDIRGMDSQTVTKLCRQVYPHATEKTYQTIWRTLRRFHGLTPDGVAVGDSVIACHGRSTIVGIGTVAAPSFYDDARGAERMRAWTHVLKTINQRSYPALSTRHMASAHAYLRTCKLGLTALHFLRNAAGTVQPDRPGSPLAIAIGLRWKRQPRHCSPQQTGKPPCRRIQSSCER